MAAIPATVGGTPVLILKEGSTRTRGRDAQRNNLNAAIALSEIVRSSLGPRGMDKMLVDSLGDITITNDGATILKEMEIEHPAAKMMVEVAKSTDVEAGDGTTSAVVLAGEFLKKAEELLDMDVHPTIVVDGYKKATSMALSFLKEIAQEVNPMDREILRQIAMTSLESKVVREYSRQLAEMAVEGILKVAREENGKYVVRLDDVKVEKKAGGSVMETKLTNGVVLDKEIVHPGMPRKITNAKIVILNSPLEIEKTEFDAKISIERPEQIRDFLEEEQRILKSMVDKIVEAGANVVLCQKGIDDIAQHYLAKAGVIAVRRVKESDIEKASKATGARVVTNVNELSEEDLGYAGLVEERKVGEDKWVFIEECKDPRSVTILIRGGTEKMVDEAERALHDAVSVVKDVVTYPYIVAGAGASEIEVAMKIRKKAETIAGKEQLAILRFAEALEAIPSALSENAGMDPIDIIAELRKQHEGGNKWIGVDVHTKNVTDSWANKVIEPLLVKEQVIKSASEAASLVLRIDDVIAASKLKEKGPPSPPPEGMGPGGELE